MKYKILGILFGILFVLAFIAINVTSKNDNDTTAVSALINNRN